jgi:DNA helicase-2/ATP-dependent DNA helicase PcrA
VRTEIIFGPPGTGKTEYLLGLVDAYLAAGLSPERIAFVSFSRRAVQEAVERALTKFPSLGREQFKHFKTIHATAYHLLDLERDDVFQRRHLDQFSQLIGLDFKNGPSEEGQPWEGTVGDMCLTVYNNARAKDIPIQEEWQRANFDNLPLRTVQGVVKQLEKFKEANGLLDFHDMLSRATQFELPTEVMIVDESQDNTRAQWNLLRAIGKSNGHIHLAGDDDQSIYGWSGSDSEMLYRLVGTRTVLPKSHRLPRRVKSFADRITAKISQRVEKQYEPRDDEGTVQWIPSIDYIDLRGKESWLLIARNNYQLRDLRELARQQGVVYSMEDGRWSWTLPSVRAAIAYESLRKGNSIRRTEAKNLLSFLSRHTASIDRLNDAVNFSDLFDDAQRQSTWMDALDAMSPSDREYIRLLRRGGESLSKPGRVRIGTAHSTKGAQADNVVVLTDIGPRVALGARVDPDAELRVQYVAVTRARTNLFLVEPQSEFFWSFN